MSERRQPLPAALRAANRLATGERRAPTTDPVALAAALHQACAQVLTSVRQTMGDDGCVALVGRAVARTEWDHPAVRTIRGPTDVDIPLEHLSSAIEAHGSGATAIAVDALLGAVYEILARLIGEDMATRIIDHDDHRPSADDGASQS